MFIFIKNEELLQVIKKCEELEIIQGTPAQFAEVSVRTIQRDEK